MSYPFLAPINRGIDQFGETVTIQKTLGLTYSIRGDISSEITSSVETLAIFNQYGKQDTFQRESSFEETNESFFFKGDQTGLDLSSYIIRSNGERWKVHKTKKHAMNGITAVQEVLVTNG